MSTTEILARRLTGTCATLSLTTEYHNCTPLCFQCATSTKLPCIVSIYLALIVWRMNNKHTLVKQWSTHNRQDLAKARKKHKVLPKALVSEYANNVCGFQPPPRCIEVTTHFYSQNKRRTPQHNSNVSVNCWRTLIQSIENTLASSSSKTHPPHRMLRFFEGPV